MAKPDTSFDFGFNLKPTSFKKKAPRGSGTKKRRRKASPASRKFWKGAFGS